MHMRKVRLFALAGGAFVAALAVTISNGTAGVVYRPHLETRAMTPAHSGLVTVPAEGGQAVSLVYRGWGDYYGLAVPGDAQGAPGGQPLDPNAQFLFAAVAATAAQNDIVNQQSGWNGTVPASPPLFNGSPAYGGLSDSYVTTCPSPNPHDNATCGYQPASGKGLEPRDGLTQYGNSVTPDSIYWGDGAPVTLANLALFNNSNGMASGYNQQRGPVVEVPLLGNGLAVPYNATNLTIPAGGLRLSRNSICGMFQGLITNWNDPSITADNGGNVIGNQPIVIVHRSDGAGTTFIFSYATYVICSQPDVNPAYQWLQGVGTLSINGPSGPVANTVIWPAGSIAAKGAGAQADAVANNPGAISYLGTSFVARSGGHESFVENQSGIFVQATIANIKAALDNGPFVQPSQTSEIPPGYPFIKNAYLPLPANVNAAPFVSYDFGYFYTCTAARDAYQVQKLHGFFKWAMTPNGGTGLTPADTIAEANGLVELPDLPPRSGGASKKTTNRTIAPLDAYAGSHSGTYTDPTTGNPNAAYTCTPLQ
jgi:ABC-type phosphate transport system substrate-binding protein